MCVAVILSFLHNNNNENHYLYIICILLMFTLINIKNMATKK